MKRSVKFVVTHVIAAPNEAVWRVRRFTRPVLEELDAFLRKGDGDHLRHGYA